MNIQIHLLYFVSFSGICYLIRAFPFSQLIASSKRLQWTIFCFLLSDAGTAATGTNYFAVIAFVIPDFYRYYLYISASNATQEDISTTLI